MKAPLFRCLGLTGLAAGILCIVPYTEASTVDLGTVAYAVQVDGIIYNAAYPSEIQTYVYTQLLQLPNAAPGLIVQGLNGPVTINEQLTALGYGENTGTLDYAFYPLTPGAGTAGEYMQNGSPSFPPSDIGPGILQSFTATMLESGTPCPGYNNVGATIMVDPTNAIMTYDTILGCDALSTISNGIPGSTTFISGVSLGMDSSGTSYEGALQTTLWEVEGSVMSGSSVPEPSSRWLIVAGMIAVCGLRICRRPAFRR